MIYIDFTDLMPNLSSAPPVHLGHPSVPAISLSAPDSRGVAWRSMAFSV